MRLIDIDVLIEYLREKRKSTASDVSLPIEARGYMKVFYDAFIDILSSSYHNADPTIHGKWWNIKVIDDDEDFGEADAVQCSECGYTDRNEYWAKNYFKYCPNCGAKMEEEKDKFGGEK